MFVFVDWYIIWNVNIYKCCIIYVVVCLDLSRVIIVGVVLIKKDVGLSSVVIWWLVFCVIGKFCILLVKYFGIIIFYIVI